MQLRVDHAVLAWSDRDELAATLGEVGLQPEEGGTHGDGTTHMSLVGFDDGSYLEVISNVPGEDPRRWPDRIGTDAGPAEWAIRTDDVPGALKRAIDVGIGVRGPRIGRRARTDGTPIEWDAGFYQDARLPFLIDDRTPRHYRVTPTETVAGGPITGIAEVVVGVPDLADAIEVFRRLYRFPTPERTTDADYGATLATVPGQPVTLAAPLEDGGWLADRLERYGPIPCAILLRAASLSAVREEYRLRASESLGNREVAWFAASPLEDRVGVLSES